MGLTVESSVSALTVFVQGLLSFFSPCVLPLVPLYIGYLAGGTKTVEPDGTVRYRQRRVMLNTVFFVLGVSFAFFLLGFGFTVAGQFFNSNRALFARIGGIIVIIFGLFQLGVFGSRLLSREARLPFRLNNKLSMNPLVALLLGFTFSFAWTPCVSPALASVLLMVSSSSSAVIGFALIALYTLGFVLPFLAVGCFTGAVLDFFKKHQKVVKYTVKIGGVLMIFMGLMMVTGWMNGITSYLSGLGAPSQGGNTSVSDGVTSDSSQASDSADSSEDSVSEETDKDAPQAPDFTLYDQYGVKHKLSDYKGKTVFLNFWATWCSPCRTEMPDIQKLYEKYGGNQEDLVVLGVANPKTDQNPFNQDGTEQEIKNFLQTNGYTYPVVMDTTGDLFSIYGIYSFPTTFMIDKNGSVFGYVSGMLTESMMESIVRQTMEGKREGAE